MVGCAVIIPTPDLAGTSNGTEDSRLGPAGFVPGFLLGRAVLLRRRNMEYFAEGGKSGLCSC